MFQRRLLVIFALAAGSGGLPSPVQAQNSQPFSRTKQSLDRDRGVLDRTRIDLKLRCDALIAQLDALNSKSVAIDGMPPGIGRDAAAHAYQRELTAWRDRRDQYNTDKQRFSDDLKSFAQRQADYDRRIKAAANANQFQVGQAVLVLWRGNWYKATVMQAEKGNYYVTYPGYGREWDEWVGPSRIRGR